MGQSRQGGLIESRLAVIGLQGLPLQNPVLRTMLPGAQTTMIPRPRSCMSSSMSSTLTGLVPSSGATWERAWR
jgi:hypothetical protein